MGGFLYSRFGWYGPFVLGLSVLGLDAVGRLLLLEKRHLKIPTSPTQTSNALEDTAATDAKNTEIPAGVQSDVHPSNPRPIDIDREEKSPVIAALPELDLQRDTGSVSDEPGRGESRRGGKREILRPSPWAVLRSLLSSRRGATSLFVTLCASITYNATVSMRFISYSVSA